MAEVVLFHHAKGRTAGFLAFADQLRAAGHTVHTPDLYDGRTFPTIDEGVAYARQVGFDKIPERAQLAVETCRTTSSMPGSHSGRCRRRCWLQTRPGARGTLLFSAAFPTTEFGGSWPQGVPLQIHMMEADEWMLEGDLDAARELDKTIEGADLFLYPGNRHLFADSSLPDYDEQAAALLMERVLAFLKKRRVDRP
jgi:dienelactone hydrolase